MDLRRICIARELQVFGFEAVEDRLPNEILGKRADCAEVAGQVL